MAGARRSRRSLHEWVEGRVLGRDPFDIEAIIGGMIRDQYQGGSTVMTAISGVEIALLGPHRQGVRSAGLPAARRPLPRALARLRQRLVRRGAHAGGVRRAGPRGGRTRLSGAEVRPVRHRLEGADAASRPRPQSNRRGGARGGRRRSRADDRVPRPARRPARPSR